MLSVGDEVDVKLLEIDAKTGKMRLSMRALTEKPEGYVEPERRPRGDRGPRRDSDRRDDRRRDDRGPRQDRRSERGDRDDRRGDRDDRRRDDRAADRRDDRGPRRSFTRREEAPAPQADDFQEHVEEIF